MKIRLRYWAVIGALLPLLSTAQTHQTAAPLTPDDVSAFLDGMLPAAIAIGDIAGAVVVVVKDDRILTSKGYGYADAERRSPVSAERTLFRPGSISKLFTWTAVMQQVEEGRLDLDADINTYLDFRIAGYGGQPIKLRHLMTHTAGFEERLKDLLIDDPKHMKPLDGVLKESIPARIYPPGAVPAYSNYGAALAGYIVQRVSGIPFDDYIEQRIFRPLAMNDSTFRQPVPAAFSDRLSNGYLQATDESVPFEFCPDTPAGALSASGADMAQFMLAHLNAGIVPAIGESSRILRPGTIELMHSVANRPAPSIDAMALGFYEQNRNGTRAIAHGGDLTAFHSDLLLIPHAKVGLYLSFNSVGRNHLAYNIRTALTEGFMDRYFPRLDRPAREPSRDGAEHARAVAGGYELSRRAERNLFSFAYMLNQTKATVTDDGLLQVDALTGLNDEPKKFQEIAPWLWQEVAGEMRLEAVRSADGAIEHLVPDGYGPIFVFQPAPGWRDMRWLAPALITASLLLSAFVLSWLTATIRRRLRRLPRPEPQPGLFGRLSRGSRIASLCCFIFAALLGVVMLAVSGDSFWIFSSAAAPFLRVIQLFALLTVIGTAVTIVAAIDSWRTPGERWWRSLGRTAIAAACLVFAYVAIAFHFLSLQLRY
jgi:CubicO group peptidase (beta-lactamase class C family)